MARRSVLVRRPVVIAPVLPDGKDVELPGRGVVFVRQGGPIPPRKARPSRKTSPPTPTFVLLHGWTVTADLNWFRCYDTVGELVPYIAFDQRGHGTGLRPDPLFHLEDCADDVIAVADALGIERIVPVGYSMGGAIAQLVARRHPDRVAGLVLCSTAAVFSETRQENFVFDGLLAAAAKTLVAAPPWLRDRLPGRVRSIDWDSPIAGWTLEQMDGHDLSLVVQAGAEIGRFRSEGWLSSIHIPTASVITSKDTVVAPTRQRQLAALIPGTEIFEVPADHRASVTDVELYRPALAAAIQSVTSRLRPRRRKQLE